MSSSKEAGWLWSVVGTSAIALALLGVIESALRVLDVPHQVAAAGDSLLKLPLFVPAKAADGTSILKRSDIDEAFRRDKPANGLRVFVIGESSVAGFPLGNQRAFPRLLQAELQRRIPDRTVEVVNVGVPGIGSWHALRLVQEIVSYGPDWVIFYLGHNDWGLSGPEEIGAFRAWASRFRFYQAAVLAGEALCRWRTGRVDVGRLQTGDPFDRVRARARGVATLSRADRAWIVTRFRDNLRAMVATARSAGARVVVSSLGQNLRDFPPGASRHRPRLGEASRAEWRSAIERGEAQRRAGDVAAALATFDVARRLDDRPAILHYLRARCLEVVGRLPAARREYLRASDLDEVPLGAPSSVNREIRAVAAETGARFVDVAHAFRRASPRGLVGFDSFTDHVHPNVDGHAVISHALSHVFGGTSERTLDRPRSPPADPQLDRQVLAANVLLYVMLGWYDEADAELSSGVERFPEMEKARSWVREKADSDPRHPWSDVPEAPD